MPELITSGKLYKAMPPLYLMDLKSLRRFYGGREWLYDKNEYYEMLNKIIVDNCDFALEDPKGKGKLPKVITLTDREKLRWLSMNNEYKLELDNLGKKAACDPRILEMVCYLKSKYPDPRDFKQQIEKVYPEMNYDVRTESLIGSWEGHFFTLICDKLFDKSAQRFMRELSRNESLFVWYKNKKESSQKLTRATIGDLLETMDRVFNVKIDQRFKGLGEADAELLFKTTVNPKYRKLLQISIKDAREATETMKLLHGKSAPLREARRELVDNTHLSYADIDN